MISKLSDREQYMSLVAAELLGSSSPTLKDAEKRSLDALGKVLGRTISLEEQAELTKAIDPWRSSGDILAQRRVAEQFLGYIGSLSGKTANEWRDGLRLQLKNAITGAPEIGGREKLDAPNMIRVHDQVRMALANASVRDELGLRSTRERREERSRKIEGSDLTRLLEIIENATPLEAAMIGAQAKRFAKAEKEKLSATATIVLERVEAKSIEKGGVDHATADRYLQLFDLVFAAKRGPVSADQLADLKAKIDTFGPGERDGIKEAIRHQVGEKSALMSALFPESSKQSRFESLNAVLELFTEHRPAAALPRERQRALDIERDMLNIQLGTAQAEMLLTMINSFPEAEREDARRLVFDKLFTPKGEPREHVTFKGSDAELMLLRGLNWQPPLERSEEIPPRRRL